MELLMVLNAFLSETLDFTYKKRYNPFRSDSMLVEFKVGNFLSFNETQTFSMKAGKYRNYSDRLYCSSKNKLVKFMSIYGANASGKSNLVSSFAFFKNLIVRGYKNGSCPYYCKLRDDNKKKESLFEIKIEIENKVFVYGFKCILNTSSFTEEWLYEELKSGSKRNVFYRDISNEKITIGTYINSQSLKKHIKMYGNDLNRETPILFLKYMNQYKDGLYENNNKALVFKSVYNWIKYKLYVNFDERPITNYSWLIDHDNLDEIAEKLNAFSIGIEKISVKNIASEKFSMEIPKENVDEIHKMLNDLKIGKKNEKNIKTPALLIRTPKNSMFMININDEGEFEYKTLEFKHKNSNARFSLGEESDGTVRLLDIIEILLNHNDDMVYIVDEINRMFHPLLTCKFVNEFLSLAIDRNIQLIVTTHESQLMNLKMLRKDEINFVNKNDIGYSSICSLMKYDDRFDKKIVNEYFNGKYDAIPIFEE